MFQNGSLDRRGFTLVELLVVIGIIAVLVSILLPTLGRARQQAETVQCASNLRQIHFAFLSYADKNKGFFPAPWDNRRLADPNNFIYQWPYQFSAFHRNQSVQPAGYSPFGTRSQTNANVTPDWAYYASVMLTNRLNAPIRFCPTIAATDLATLSQQSPGTPGAIALSIQNYSMAINTPSPAGGTTPSIQGYAKPTRIKNGSTKPYLFDVSGDGGRLLGPSGLITRARPWANYANVTQWSSRPHAGGRRSNFLFYDGHIETLVPSELKPAQMDTTQP
jgi:prepilin-type N-terminal cleavage/methylation domain-containing protein/prepilin-type processing-associated H-X9-DG protein